MGCVACTDGAHRVTCQAAALPCFSLLYFSDKVSVLFGGDSC